MCGDIVVIETDCPACGRLSRVVTTEDINHSLKLTCSWCQHDLGQVSDHLAKAQRQLPARDRPKKPPFANRAR